MSDRRDPLERVADDIVGAFLDHIKVDPTLPPGVVVFRDGDEVIMEMMQTTDGWEIVTE